jgi:hypothetical protein
LPTGRTSSSSTPSGNYYFNDSGNGYAGNQFRYRLREENPDDAWYYSTLALGDGCHLNVNNDANLHVTKVWMNCVIREGREGAGACWGPGIDLTAFIQEVVNVPQKGVMTSMFVDRQGLVQAHRDQNAGQPRQPQRPRCGSKRYRVPRCFPGQAMTRSAAPCGR